MIRIAFFDVGETLIHEGQPFPGAAEALAAISGFETADGHELFLGIVSDYLLPSPPRTEEKIAALEEQYRNQVLQPSGLAGFFQPFESRVTISSRAGVSKPNRKIFEAAVARSGTGAPLSECLFVTENTVHLNKCAEYDITPVRFGPAAGGMARFKEWADAPAVIAGLVAPGHAGNRVAAVATALASRFGLLGFTPTGGSAGTVRGLVSQLIQLNDPRLGPLDGVYVERSTEVKVELGPDGRVAGVANDQADSDEVADAVNFVSTLVKSGRVEIPGQAAPPFGVTHVVERDTAGRLRLIRRGYSRR
jgi:FMN phosphatase YigB (HAD superfamily)